MACPICKKKNKIFSIKVKDFEYNIYRHAVYIQCKSCKSIYRKHPKKIEKSIYTKTKYLPLKGNMIYNFLKNIYAEHEKNKISKSLSYNFFHKQRIILDIACGKGFLIEKFSKNRNLRCYGTDVHIQTIKKENVSFIKSSFDNIKLIKKIKPDLIIINNFIEHMENPRNINKIIFQMKRNSYLFIITPDANSCARKKFSVCWSGYHSPRHKTIFNQKSIKKIIAKYKNVNLEQSKIYDPFSNFISISNFMKQVSLKSIIFDIFKIPFFLFFIFTDFSNKNRILLKVRRN
jgi:2-polyprenyl-3-methyl-5-hydroxy-6-metoxy-1,4-benzoquinol methylase